MKSAIKGKIIKYGFIISLLFCVTGCGKEPEERPNSGVTYYHPPKEETESPEENGTNEEEGRELFLILSNSSTEESMHLYRYADGGEYLYYYGLNTRFLDKYGNVSSAVKFTPGRAVYIGRPDDQGKLTKIQIAGEVWEYEDVTRFSVEESRGIFQIVDTRYRIWEGTFVFSDENRINVSDLTRNDRLSVVGLDNRILSVVVTTGHGTLQLENTGLFEGSHIQIGRGIFAEVTPDMAMELPEGAYRLTVANDGWGGSCDIQIFRGETTVMDLDTIKGEGPKYGKILFVVDAPDAKIFVDGKLVEDATEPLSLRYGKHSIQIAAQGYSLWDKYLMVNSPEATILISLEDKNGSSGNGGTSGGNGSSSESGTASGGGIASSGGTSSGNVSGGSSGGNGSSGGSSGNSGSSGGNSSGSGNSDLDSTTQLLKDYLSTMQNMYIYDKLYQLPKI